MEVRPSLGRDRRGWYPARASGTQPKARLGIRDTSSARGAFSFDDPVGDIDGYLIGSLANDNLQRPLDDVVREVRTNIAESSTWRFSAFYSQRFGGSSSAAKSAAADVFTSGDFLIGAAVRYTLGGFEFAVAPAGGSAAPPTIAEIDAVSDVWAELIVALASGGASEAPAP